MLKHLNYDCIGQIFSFIDDPRTLTKIMLVSRSLYDFICSDNFENNVIYPLDVKLHYQSGISFIWNNKNELKSCKNFCCHVYDNNYCAINLKDCQTIKKLIIYTTDIDSSIIHVKINKLGQANIISYCNTKGSYFGVLEYNDSEISMLSNKSKLYTSFIKTKSEIYKLYDRSTKKISYGYEISNKGLIVDFYHIFLNKNQEYEFDIEINNSITIDNVRNEYDMKFEKSFKSFHKRSIFSVKPITDHLLQTSIYYLMKDSCNLYYCDLLEFLGYAMMFDHRDNFVCKLPDGKEIKDNVIYWIDSNTKRYIIKPKTPFKSVNFNQKITYIYPNTSHDLQQFSEQIFGTYILENLMKIKSTVIDIILVLVSLEDVLMIAEKIRIMMNVDKYKLLKTKKLGNLIRYAEVLIGTITYRLWGNITDINLCLKSQGFSGLRALYADQVLMMYPSFYRTLKYGISYNLHNNFNKLSMEIYEKYFKMGFGFLLNKHDFKMFKNHFDNKKIEYKVVIDPKTLDQD